MRDRVRLSEFSRQCLYDCLQDNLYLPPYSFEDLQLYRRSRGLGREGQDVLYNLG
jgi:hypothetical protein